jgi:hypothetical protein
VTKPATSSTTAQSLGAFLKSAPDIMRKDRGLNGDLDRLPMLTWIMFLKFLDDLKLQCGGGAKRGVGLFLRLRTLTSSNSDDLLRQPD